MTSPDISVLVQAAAFDPGGELNAFTRDRPQAGAVAQFTGLVRDLNQGARIDGLHLEHYPGMTEHSLHEICAAACTRWPLLGVRVIHRFGDLLPGDPIVAVLCAAAHRGDAFAACAFIMDLLKTEAPFWKRERTPDGERWVEARAADHHAAQRWAADPAAQAQPDALPGGWPHG